MAVYRFSADKGNYFCDVYQVWDAATNTSNIDVEVWFSGSNTTYNIEGGEVNVWINGINRSFWVQREVKRGQSTWRFGTVSFNKIGHNTDGTLRISFRAEANIDMWVDYGTPVYQTKGVWNNTYHTMDTIPRASSISCSSGYIESIAKINISKLIPSATHTVTYTCGNLSGTIATKTNQTAIDWTIPSTFYAQIPNTNKISVKLKCQTYNGSLLVGENSTSFNAYVDPNTNKPLLNPSVKDTNAAAIALTGSANILIKNFSNAEYSVNATGKNSATIKETRVEVGGIAKTESTGTFDSVTDGSFKFSATDSRGYVTELTIKKQLIDYMRLTCYLAATNPTTDGTLAIKGNGIYFAGSFGSVANTLTVQYRIRESTAATYALDEWITITPTIDTARNRYSFDTVVTGLDYRKRYYIQVRATDKLMTALSLERSVKTTPVFDWSENDFNLNVPLNMDNKEVMDITTDGKMVVMFGGGEVKIRPNGRNSATGELRINSEGLYYNGKSIGDGGGGSSTDSDRVIASGVTNGWTWRKWNSGLAECWKDYSTTSSFTEQHGALYYSDTILPSDTYPFNFTKKPRLYLSSGTAGVIPGAYTQYDSIGSTCNFCFYSTTRKSWSANVYMNVYVVGNWK